MVKNAWEKPQFRTNLAAHMEFVKAQYAEGIVLFSGTKPHNSGGVRVIKCADDADVETFWKPDPMAAAGMLEYRVTPFEALDVSEQAKPWFAL